MRFAVETWAPEYGSPAEGGALAETDVVVDLDVERPAAAWSPITPPPPASQEEERPVLFVDGVRRIEARVWLGDPDGEDGGVARPGICASYAAGIVRCETLAPPSRSRGRARVVTAEVARAVFCRAAGAAPIDTRCGRFALRSTPADDPDTLSLALQGAMADLELQVSVGAAAPGALLVVDGPLGARRGLPGTVGYIKTHHVSYLPTALHGVIGALGAGQRTPVFCMGERFARHSWYLRLPGELSHAWAGVVRCETAVDIGPEPAVALADRLCAVLPRYASSAHKDPRAPQNLFPIAGLERELRRRLGDPLLIQRALREAARRSRPDQADPAAEATASGRP
jgi:hypothetical protein